MPKERIVPSDHMGPYEVQVGWHSDGDSVQIGVEESEGRSLLWTIFGDEENLERLGAEMATLVQQFIAGQCVLEPGETIDDKRSFAINFGRAILNRVESGPFPPSEHGAAFYTGVWATLTREDCNRVIRVVRRARDQAFGADA